MRALASFIMRGRGQAILAAVGSAALMWILPPLNILLGGIVALVTLRHGPIEGLLLIAGTFLISAALATLGAADSTVVTAFMTMLGVATWPVWLLAVVLRRTISLSITVTVAAVLGALVVAGFHLVLDEPVAWWKQVFSAAAEQTVASTGAPVDMESLASLVDIAARWMTGTLAAALAVGSLVALFLGRWWQAMLYNPGGFRQEFQGLRLGNALAIAVGAVMLAAWWLGGTGGQVASDLLWVAGAIYMLPGLSVIHMLLAGTSHPVGGLVVLYILLAIVPHVAVLVALVGWADTWLDMRSRIGARKA